MSKTVAVTSEYRNLPLAQLQESPTNPRRRFDERGLNELAESFKSQGVLQPLLVRAIDEDKYEVVAGARRLRAAKLAELSKVPARVVELSDAAVRESQLTENLAREDVHPYEEAIALKGILQLEGAQYDIASLSARLGKSQSYLTQRMRLTELHPSIAEAFLADQYRRGPCARNRQAAAGPAGEGLRCRVSHGLEQRQGEPDCAAGARIGSVDRAEHFALARFRALRQERCNACARGWKLCRVPQADRLQYAALRYGSP